MQHGAKSATPPARNAARTEPVVRRSFIVRLRAMMAGARPSLRSSRVSLRRGRRPWLKKAPLTRTSGLIPAPCRRIRSWPAASRTSRVITRNSVAVGRELLERLVRVGAEVARGGLDHGDLGGPVRWARTRGQGCLLGRFIGCCQHR